MIINIYYAQTIIIRIMFVWFTVGTVIIFIRLFATINFNLCTLVNFENYSVILQFLLSILWQFLLQLVIALILEEFLAWLFFQQDGSSPHWGSLLRDIVEEICLDWWIGKDRITPWPTCSLILHLLIFSVGVALKNVKDKVFTTPIADIEELKARMQTLCVL